MTPEPTSRSAEVEGVIKFDLEFTQGQARPLEKIVELNAWRQIFFRLGLIGRDPSRYGGLSYGNLSQATGLHRFIVSGTGTGGKESLSLKDYCLVMDFDLEKNWIRAEGPVKPSSEALTHGAVYDANPQIGSVLHVHSPEIWRNARQLAVCLTDESIAYGTPEMGRAVGKAAKNTHAGIIAMGGHEDGVIAFAENMEGAAINLLRCLEKAMELEQRPKQSGR